MSIDNPDRVTYFGQTDSRNKRVPFGIKAKDRSRHTYVIGKTGMGKSTLLENMAVQDIQNGEGLVFIDPHGKTADLLLDYVPKERIEDVLYFAPFDSDFPVSFNIMEDVGTDKRHLVMSGLISAFKKIWVDAWSARMEYILGNTLLALLEYPGATLLSVNRMYSDKDYRKKVVANVSDPTVRSFWVDEFDKYTDRFAAEATPAIQNKIGQFTSNPLIRNIIGQETSSFDLRQMMDEKKIILINLSKGRVGEVNSNLLGSMLITKIYLSAMSRADVTEIELEKLPNLYLFVDEFQSFANESFADILSEARKYKLALTLAHQYIAQMSDEVRDAVFGNVGTMVSFRVGAYDAEVLEREFAPAFTQEDMVNLGFTQIYLKLMINGVTSAPFSATTLPPVELPEISYRNEIIESSRSRFAQPRSKVEETIKRWHGKDAVVEEAPPKIKRPKEAEASRPPRSAGRVDRQGNNNRNQSQPRGAVKEKIGPAVKRPPLPPEEDLSPAEELRRGLSSRNRPDNVRSESDLNVNRSALREALASIDPKNNQKEKSKEKSSGKATGIDRAQVDKKTESDRRDKRTDQVKKDHQPSSDPAKDPDQKDHTSGPREVPEDELRRILSVEEDSDSRV